VSDLLPIRLHFIVHIHISRISNSYLSPALSSISQSVTAGDLKTIHLRNLVPALGDSLFVFIALELLG